MMDKLLEKYGLKFEDLEDNERETLDGWLVALQSSKMSVEKIKEYIHAMKEAVESELAKSDLGSKQDLFLKARLRNYMLLSAFMTSPEKAKEQIEAALSSMAVKK